MDKVTIKTVSTNHNLFEMMDKVTIKTVSTNHNLFERRVELVW